jgi:hypothetical protein
MTTTIKTFDCVKMKRDIQEQLRAEYEARKQDYASYVDFLRAKAEESDWVRQLRRRFAGKQ